MSEKAAPKPARNPCTVCRFMLTCGYIAYFIVAGTVADEQHRRPWAHETSEPWKTGIAIMGGMVWPLIAAPKFGRWIVDQTMPLPT